MMSHAVKHTVAAAGTLGVLLLAAPSYAQTGPTATKEPPMTSQAQYTRPTSAQPRGAAVDTTIRPFHFTAPQAALDDLRRRIQATVWPDRETVADASQGVQLATMQKLARYWATEYDWRKVEARLNALPQFITQIDGLDIHFIHVRSKHKNAMPMIITHGWRIARAWAVLMNRLGYTRYVAQGGDWGAVVTEQMGLQAPPGLLGIHVNMPGVFPADIDGAAFSGAPTPSGLSDDEKVAYERLRFVYQKGIAYGFQMGLRPQTLYGIADSPVGLAAYFLDHDARSYALIARVFDGQSEGLTRDDILDNITITWLTNTALSGARLYWEYWGKGYFNSKGVSIPVAVSVFPDELYPAPRSWTERAFPKLIYYKKADKGGHFAAWEQPQILVEDLRAGLRSLRSTQGASR